MLPTKSESRAARIHGTAGKIKISHLDIVLYLWAVQVTSIFASGTLKESACGASKLIAQTQIGINCSENWILHRHSVTDHVTEATKQELDT